MKGEHILKIKAVLLYIIQNSNQNRRDVYSIVKTAYYAQQTHFAKWALPIFKDRIAALKFGPVPSTIYDILKISRGDISVQRFHQTDCINVASDAIGFEDESFFAKEYPDMDFLSASEIECLDSAIRKVGSMGFGEIADDTHGEEWARVWNDSSLHYMNDLQIAKEGGADDAIVCYLKEALTIDEVLG